MHAGKYLPGLIATFAALPALAQQATPTPAPVQIPPPTITTIPGVVPERFSIAPPRATPSPTPTATPTPAPVVTPQPRAAAPVQARRQPVPQAAQPVSVPNTSPVAIASPVQQAAPVQPQIIASPTPAPAPVQQPASQAWLWALLGAGGTAAAGLAGWALLRRRRPVEDEAPVVVAEAATAPPPAVRGPSPKPLAPPPAPASADPFEIILQPLRIQIGEREVSIELELTIANTTASSADGIRLTFAAISASPRQDAQLASLHANSQLAPSADPFDLAAGSRGRSPLRLILPREEVHVVDLGGRAMFVPIVAIQLRWRAGLSIRHYSASFMLGGAGQGGKIAPIWLDRGQPRGPFAASRYLPASAVAAA